MLLLSFLPARATAQECAILWESGHVRLDAKVSPQEIRMEWRLLYCPGVHYSAGLRVPGRIKVEGRMDGAGWKEALSETVPGGLLELAPDRHVGATWNGCC